MGRKQLLEAYNEQNRLANELQLALEDMTRKVTSHALLNPCYIPNPTSTMTLELIGGTPYRNRNRNRNPNPNPYPNCQSGSPSLARRDIGELEVTLTLPLTLTLTLILISTLTLSLIPR